MYRVLPVGYLTRCESFSAAHRLHSKHLSAEANKQVFGKCNNDNGHGHNYQLEVTVRGSVDPNTGMVMNVADLKIIMGKSVLNVLDHKHIDLDVPFFKNNGVASTAENIAIFAYNAIESFLPENVQLYSVRLRETDKNWFEYRGEFKEAEESPRNMRLRNIQSDLVAKEGKQGEGDAIQVNRQPAAQQPKRQTVGNSQEQSMPEIIDLSEIPDVIKDTFSKICSDDQVFSGLEELCKKKNVKKLRALINSIRETKLQTTGNECKLKPTAEVKKLTAAVETEIIEIEEIKKVVEEDKDKDKEIRKLVKIVRGILNKMTPEKYVMLANQLFELKIDTEDKIGRVVELIFEKAVEEQGLYLQYSGLCKKLANKVLVGDKKNPLLFKKLLLTKCQNEFEFASGMANLEILQQEVNDCQDEEKKNALKKSLDSEMKRVRKQRLGNCKLIGGFYKLNLIKKNIILKCIQTLLFEKSDDESLECLCALLEIVGEPLDKEYSTNAPNSYLELDFYFEKLNEIVDKNFRPNTSAKVRFLVQDIIELRQNNWKPRKSPNNETVAKGLFS